jgi:SET domain-containing protein
VYHSKLFVRKENLVLNREKEIYENLLYVNESEIHGAGLFTSVGIKEGQKIMIIRGESISGDECEKREEDGNVYIFWNGETYIDTAMTDKIKYINHNCSYNCDIIDRDNESLFLIAARNIEPDEELTIDYGYDEIYELCNCEICSEYLEDALEIKKAV